MMQLYASHRRHPWTSGALAFCAAAFLPSLADVSLASPQFARQHQVACGTCHSLPPKLNLTGLDFQARGYRLPPGVAATRESTGSTGGTVPLAIWLTGRYEDKTSGSANDLFLPKVELISGGRFGRNWSYFAEWRIVSLGLNDDGSQSDRSGRFEDLFVTWEPAEGQTLRLGQFRLLQQTDVSLRLSPSDPLLFNNGLRVREHRDPRLNGLATFSPSSRSPSVSYTVRSVNGERPADGLFHAVTLPFVGELSIPLSDEASRRASFEVGSPKGAFLETYFRKAYKTIGAHAFIEDDAWLITLLGTLEWRNLYLTAGLGIDDPVQASTRNRSSLELEYLITAGTLGRYAAGLRLEDVSDDGRRTALVPYLVASMPNRSYTLLFQAQYKSQDGADNLVLDLSLLF